MWPFVWKSESSNDKDLSRKLTSLRLIKLTSLLWKPGKSLETEQRALMNNIRYNTEWKWLIQWTKKVDKINKYSNKNNCLLNCIFWFYYLGMTNLHWQLLVWNPFLSINVLKLQIVFHYITLCKFFARCFTSCVFTNLKSFSGPWEGALNESRQWCTFDRKLVILITIFVD